MPSEEETLLDGNQSPCSQRTQILVAASTAWCPQGSSSLTGIRFSLYLLKRKLVLVAVKTAWFGQVQFAAIGLIFLLLTLLILTSLILT